MHCSLQLVDKDCLLVVQGNQHCPLKLEGNHCPQKSGDSQYHLPELVGIHCCLPWLGDIPHSPPAEEGMKHRHQEQGDTQVHHRPLGQEGNQQNPLRGMVPPLLPWGDTCCLPVPEVALK